MSPSFPRNETGQPSSCFERQLLHVLAGGYLWNLTHSKGYQACVGGEVWLASHVLRVDPLTQLIRAGRSFVMIVQKAHRVSRNVRPVC